MGWNRGVLWDRLEQTDDSGEFALDNIKNKRPCHAYKRRTELFSNSDVWNNRCCHRYGYILFGRAFNIRSNFQESKRRLAFSIQFAQSA
jgi:hypothetical protein